MATEEPAYRVEEQSWYASDLPETREMEEAKITDLAKRIDVVLITATEIE